MAAMTAVFFLTLSLVSVPGVFAKPQTQSGNEVLAIGSFNDYEYWDGTLTGDITGTIQIYETSANFYSGMTMHFFETFTITTSCGTISGTDSGVWNFADLKWRAHGPVTAATGCYSGLVGYTFHEMGVSTDPNLSDPVTAIASWSLTP